MFRRLPVPEFGGSPGPWSSSSGCSSGGSPGGDPSGTGSGGPDVDSLVG